MSSVEETLDVSEKQTEDDIDLKRLFQGMAKPQMPKFEEERTLP
jgi:hypothetical protein